MGAIQLRGCGSEARAGGNPVLFIGGGLPWRPRLRDAGGGSNPRAPLLKGGGKTTPATRETTRQGGEATVATPILLVRDGDVLLIAISKEVRHAVLRM